MKVDGKHFRTIWLKEDDPNVVQIIDQRPLPHRFIIEDLTTGTVENHSDDGAGGFTYLTRLIDAPRPTRHLRLSDQDRDGDLDLVTLGQDADGDRKTVLYTNDGATTPAAL